MSLADIELIAQSEDRFNAAELHAALQACQRDLKWLSRSFDGDQGAERDDSGARAEQRRQVLEQVERMRILVERSLGVIEASATGRLAMLSREADHRIRNSLQQVISGLHRQATQATSSELRDALELASARVYAVAQVHAVLAGGQAVGPTAVPGIDVADYLRDLCDALRDALITSGGRHLLEVQAETYRLPPGDAQAIGVIVTELVANAVRHAFSGTRPGVILVVGAQRRDGCYQVGVHDNGDGLPSSFDLRLRAVGTGLRVVSLLADRLRARLTVDGRAGSRFTLTLPPEPDGSTARS